MSRRRVRTIDQTDAVPKGSIADDRWGHEFIRHEDGWVREIWIDSAELLADGPVYIEDQPG
ncbi:hypothetical protein [Nocardia ignorata]|uniref:Uncharacterized protein n=1 Tax=Nocardia ignorata TaxID=145285 RepID=A0A4R6NXI6_NOCIG|nr:hypothetical protein [Nocardia ignorata]TDP27620.1 hypothetical protein DFR75_12311 [Nocardia ignorata]